MRILKPGREFKATVEVVCPRCGAKLELDATDIKLGSKCSMCFTYKCAYCKKHNVAKSTEVLTAEIIDEYDELIK